jgi:hypothetical protein
VNVNIQVLNVNIEPNVVMNDTSALTRRDIVALGVAVIGGAASKELAKYLPGPKPTVLAKNFHFSDGLPLSDAPPVIAITSIIPSRVKFYGGQLSNEEIFGPLHLDRA